MSNPVVERKGRDDDKELCFYEKFSRCVYDVVSGDKIRFIEAGKIARCYVSCDWDKYKKMLEEVDDPDKYGLLGNLFWWGRGVDQNYEKAVEIYRKGMEMGSGYATSELGSAFSMGSAFSIERGVEEDDEKAAELFRKGMNMGSGSAAANLGNAFWCEKGVEQSYEKAVELYRKGMNMGSGSAAANLGNAFWCEKGVEQSYEKAVELYRKGMKMGNGFAAAKLGYAFWRGRGIEQNYEKAVELYIAGIKMGSGHAKEEINDVLNDMDEFSDKILDMLWGIDALPMRMKNLVLKRKVGLLMEKNERQEKELKKLQLERSNAGKILGGNLCSVISEFI